MKNTRFDSEVEENISDEEITKGSVSLALSILCTELNEVNDIVGLLENKLASVLSSGIEDTSVQEKNTENCKVSQELRTFIDNTQDTKERLTSIIKRLQL